MELKAVVQYLGDWAHYSVTPETAGIYHARLLKYEGPNVVTPPENITLVRSASRWVGSYEEQHFVEELGRAIDDRVRAGDPSAH